MFDYENLLSIRWKKVARDILTEYMSNIHENISIRDSGLFRSEVYPHLGASPDGILKCSCCETIFMIEIKCPIKQEKCHKQNLQ